MNTPIFDFLEQYNRENPTRMHMPGHKGVDTALGIEHYDITEIDGADNLYAPEGIIAQSERNASELFGSHTLYSTEGSSLAIRAMLFMVVRWCRVHKQKPVILAARNAHKTYINTCALLDIDTKWIMSKRSDSYESCSIEPQELEACINALDQRPVAVYITTPDYLGNIIDIQGIASVCHKYDILLLVDNAHGAYLKYLSPSMHPIDLGADICADSAHKTLPVLTGGAYLHISNSTDSFFIANARNAMDMFGSTSPSYLILASLDLANDYLGDFKSSLSIYIPKLKQIKKQLVDIGYYLIGDEPLKFTFDIEKCLFISSGITLAEYLMRANIYPEYYDEDHVVLMLTPNNGDGELELLVAVLTKMIEEIDPDEALKERLYDKSVMQASRICVRGKHNLEEALKNHLPEVGLIHEKTDSFLCDDNRVTKPIELLSPHEAIYADSEEVPAEKCSGRILAQAQVSCPPAVPVYMMGEQISDISLLSGIVKVIKE